MDAASRQGESCLAGFIRCKDTPAKWRLPSLAEDLADFCLENLRKKTKKTKVRKDTSTMEGLTITDFLSLSLSFFK